MCPNPRRTLWSLDLWIEPFRGIMQRTPSSSSVARHTRASLRVALAMSAGHGSRRVRTAPREAFYPSVQKPPSIWEWNHATFAAFSASDRWCPKTKVFGHPSERAQNIRNRWVPARFAARGFWPCPSAPRLTYSFPQSRSDPSCTVQAAVRACAKKNGAATLLDHVIRLKPVD